MSPIDKTTESHIPVLLDEVVENLNPQEGEVYLDCTFGRGGYTRAILEKAQCRVIAIDCDPSAIAHGQKMVTEFDGRLTLKQGRFSEMSNLLAEEGITQLDGIVFDLGVSSPQLDEAERGFSFKRDGVLDMRMSQDGQTAADLVNSLPEEELANIIYLYGEERLSRRIARNIVLRRTEQPFEKTGELASVVRASIPPRKDGKDAATRTFQGLRIAVNNELGEVEDALAETPALLHENGRLVVVSFHSLEDKIVKKFLTEKAGLCYNPSRHIPHVADVSEVLFSLPSKKAVQPSEAEKKRNPRARSAKLRLGIRRGRA
ncbi:MAG: 16S rRNA (cytosine(1402)-N(4))-methyltransferase RsmH [Alphaproteobacteria bacterium]